MLNVLSFFFTLQKMNYENEAKLVSMLNVLSFFFMLVFLICLVAVQKRFDAQRFELFLYKVQGDLWQRRIESFDAQRFELFLYRSQENHLVEVLEQSFRCSTFWAFSLYSPNNNLCMTGSMFRCSIFWAFSLLNFTFSNGKAQLNVSMLNFLSFFFIVPVRNAFSFYTMYTFRCSIFWAFSL